MTSNVLPSPFVASASTNHIQLLPWMAFDNTLGILGYWVTNGVSTGWLTLDIGSGNSEILVGYTIYVNTIPEPNRAPKDWTVEGSNTGAFAGEEVTLDTVTGEVSWGSGEGRTFTCDVATTAYRYFRINITDNNGDTYLQIGELILYKDSITTIVPTTVLTTLAPTTLTPTSLAPTTIVTTVAPTTIAPGWIGENRNSGPWDFIEQKDKWGYLNNPRWSNHPKGAADSISALEFCEDIGLATGIDETHEPCGHWHKYKPISADDVTEIITPLGEWVAALEQRETPYIYFYDIDLFSIVKVDTSPTDPVVADMLVVNDADYTLDRQQGVGQPQKGAYCISKEFNKIWYLFKKASTGDLKLVEIDITTSPMTIIKTSLHSAIMPGESFHDGAADDDYAFFTTTKVSGRILKFDTSHTLTDHDFGFADIGAADEAIRTITLNPTINEVFFMRNENIGPACRNIAMDYNFNITNTLVQVDSGTDSARWQNFARYDEKYDKYIKQRIYHPSNGILYYLTGWFGSVGEKFDGYVQDLQYMKQYLGGSATYFYILKTPNADTSDQLHRFTHRHGVGNPALTQISIDVTAYTRRFLNESYNSIYNEETGKSVLHIWDSANSINYLATFDTTLTLIADTPISSGVSIISSDNTIDQSDNEPQIWPIIW